MPVYASADIGTPTNVHIEEKRLLYSHTWQNQWKTNQHLDTY